MRGVANAPVRLLLSLSSNARRTCRSGFVGPVRAPLERRTTHRRSSLNFDAGKTVGNLVVIKLGAGGRFSLFNNWGWTDVVIDVVGWYS